MRAIHELLTEQDDDKTRTLSRTTPELNELKCAISHEWTVQIDSQNIQETTDLQPCFVIQDSIREMLHEKSCPIQPVLFMDNFLKINILLHQP